jgi:hypothetical protein
MPLLKTSPAKADRLFRKFLMWGCQLSSAVGYIGLSQDAPPSPVMTRSTPTAGLGAGGVPVALLPRARGRVERSEGRPAMRKNSSVGGATFIRIRSNVSRRSRLHPPVRVEAVMSTPTAPPRRRGVLHSFGSSRASRALSRAAACRRANLSSSAMASCASRRMRRHGARSGAMPSAMRSALA